VFDGDGAPMPDCMLEIWQADAQGRFSDPQDQRAQANSSFKGFGRIGTDANGGYAFDTIKPGQVADPDGKMQAPHLSLAVYARGMLLHLYSRIYFGGEVANAADPVLALVPADRRHCKRRGIVRLDAGPEAVAATFLPGRLRTVKSKSLQRDGHRVVYASKQDEKPFERIEEFIGILDE
jgi:protocatechuate 3,4-dioxygenase beta subunit